MQRRGYSGSESPSFFLCAMENLKTLERFCTHERANNVFCFAQLKGSLGFLGGGWHKAGIHEGHLQIPAGPQSRLRAGMWGSGFRERSVNGLDTLRSIEYPVTQYVSRYYEFGININILLYTK